MTKMISFACKRISQEELIRCSFELNKTEYNILLFLLENKNFYSASQIGEYMELERTTIQKSIKKLVEKNLAIKIQRNLPQGGYTFLYKVKNEREIKKKMKRIVYEWYRHVVKAITNF